MQDVGLFWQLTIKTIEDLKVVGNENLTLEMYIMQLVHLKTLDYNLDKLVEKGIPIKQDVNQSEIKTIEKTTDINTPDRVKSQLKNTNQIKTSPIKNLNNQNEKTKIEITSFQDLIDRSNLEKEIELKFDLERNVKLVSFNKGKIDISFNDKLNKNFIKNLTDKLLQWTGERWIISLSKNNEAKSVFEKNLENKKNKINEFKKSKIAKEFESIFPDAELIDIEKQE